jgi:hypothetical protein
MTMHGNAILPLLVFLANNLAPDDARVVLFPDVPQGIRNAKTRIQPCLVLK